jgi:hypothetical protein
MTGDNQSQVEGCVLSYVNGSAQLRLADPMHVSRRQLGMTAECTALGAVLPAGQAAEMRSRRPSGFPDNFMGTATSAYTTGCSTACWKTASSRL